VKRAIQSKLGDPEARETLLQLSRYGMIGAAITILGQLIYYVLAETRTTSPLVAIAIAWIVGVAVGYFAHGWISFRGHGPRSDHARMGSRFIAVNVVGYVLNSFWVWLLVERLGGPNWWPIPPNVILTPLMTFWLHRHWTFR
ncbi:MAG TPA: GtrA family protein, partial [Sphingomicrobium sp.]|nr:GtrA family protein [Sphingomicrobium sp.]